MKMQMHILILSAVAVSGHHCNEYQCAFFNKNTPKAPKSDEIDGYENLMNRHDMHSFTGAEGIDHENLTRRSASPKRWGKSGGHKSVVQTKLQTSTNLIHRHDMHSFTGSEGIDHSPTKENDTNSKEKSKKGHREHRSGKQNISGKGLPFLD